MAVQADHYVICMLPPAPGEVRRQMLIPQILGANGYTAGSASVDFQVSDLALEDSFFVFSMKAYEDRTGRKVDMNRSRVHNFTGNTARGKMLAMFLLR
jgi:hypothetical protein